MTQSASLSIPRPDRTLPACLGLLALILIAYWPVLHNAGYIWDDPQHLTECQAVKDPAGLARIWTWPITLSPGQAAPTQQYYPMVFTSFWIECRLWGLEHPVGFHLVNILLHAATAMLIWLVLRRLSIPGAWLAAALFALHPVQVESVAWISERKNLLAAFFFLLTLLVYLRFARLDTVGSPSRQSKDGGARSGVPPLGGVPAAAMGSASRRSTEGGGYRWPLYGWMLLLFIAALLSKSTACALPAVILLITWYKRGRLSRADFFAAAPMFVIGLASAALTVWIERRYIGAAGPDWDLSFTQRLLIAGRAFWFYPQSLLWPANLAFIYPRWNPANLSPVQWLCPITALLIPAILLAFHKSIGRGPFVAIALYAVNIFPALGFFNIFPMRYSFIADHYQYLACLGLFLLITVPAGRLLDLLDPADRRLGSFAALPVLAVLAFLTFRQGAIYRDQESLWRDTIAKNPTSWMARENFAYVLYRKAKTERANDLRLHDLALSEDNFKEAIKLRPNYYKPMLGLGQVYIERHEYDRAEDILGLAHNVMDPLDIDVDVSLGLCYVNRGRPDRAIDYLLQYADNPDFQRNAIAQDVLATAHSNQHELDEAIKYHKLAIQLDPANAAYHNSYGSTLVIREKYFDAILQFEEAIRLRSDFADAYNNLGQALRIQKQFDLAIKNFRHAIQLQPTFHIAHANLAEALVNVQRPEEAVGEYRAALALYPTSMEYLCGLAEILSSDDPQIRDLPLATTLAKKACKLTENNNVRAVYLLAQIYAEQKKMDEAIDCADIALRRAMNTQQDDLARSIAKSIETYRYLKLVYGLGPTTTKPGQIVPTSDPPTSSKP